VSTANAIKITLGIKYANGSLVDAVNSFTTAITQQNQEEDAPTVSIGTSEQDVTFTDVTTLGWIYMLNLDAANYVEWGPKSAGVMVPLGRMQAGEPAVLRLDPGITLRMKANTAPVKVQFKAFGN